MKILSISYPNVLDFINILETKFHMTTPYDWLAKTYTNCNGHMTNIATMPIYGKNSLNLFYSGTKRPLAMGVGM